MRKLSVLGGAVVFFDQLTKLFVRGFMGLGEEIEILSFFSITYVENKGIAWGLFANHEGGNYVFLTLNVLALVFLFVNYSKFKTDKVTIIAWTLIMAGAIGNLGDRIFLGAVVDFLDFGVGRNRWPIFNIADVSITIGGFLLFYGILKSLFERKILRKNCVSE